MPAARKKTTRKKATKTDSAQEQRSLQAMWLNNLFNDGYLSGSGIAVNASNALTVSPVWQAVDVITSDVSRMPFLVYRTTGDGRGKERATDHPAYKILRRSVGAMTANLWIARTLGHALLYGNGYSMVKWIGSRLVGMEWLHRDWVQKYQDGFKSYYIVRYPQNRGGNTIRVNSENMFHLIGLTMDDMGGLSLVDYARNTFARQMAAEGFADDFFGNDATPSGFFKHPGEMSEQAQQRFLSSFNSSHRGHGNRWKVGVLEEGMEWIQSGISPQDALLIDQLKLGVMDVARFFNLPPHKLGDASRVNYNSLEAEEKSYYSGSLGKWISRLEFEATDKLFLDSEIEEGYFAEFLQDSANKADTAARYQAYSIAIQWGIMSRNEVRSRENLNPYDGGDEYLTPLTHQQPTADPAPADPQSNDQQTPTDNPPAPDTTPTRTVFVVRDVLVAKLDDAARLLANSANRLASKPGQFLAGINGLERHTAAIQAMTSQAINAAEGYTGRSLGDISRRLLDAATERYLTAAECQPEELIERVADAGLSLRAWARDLATDLVLGDQ